MPGYELINFKEQKEVNKLFKEGGVLFAHGFENLRKKYHVREFEKKCAQFFESKRCLAVSSGTAAIKIGLKALGVKKVTKLYCEPNGIFPHNPEPLPENLSGIAHEVVFNKADLGIVVDPDVDRLALVCEDGNMFGEEYTLALAADGYIKQRQSEETFVIKTKMADALISKEHFYLNGSFYNKSGCHSNRGHE